MKYIIFSFKVILIAIAIPFMIIPAICFAGLIALDNADTKPVQIMKHANMIHKRDIK